MQILSETHPCKQNLTIEGKEWHFPYKVYEAIELDSSVVVCFNWPDVQANLPSRDFYFGCTVWCYNKSDRSIKWIIEEPPIIIENGKPANRGMSPYLAGVNRDELYLCVFYNDYYKSILVDTTGARRFKLDHETGKVEFLYGGLR